MTTEQQRNQKDLKIPVVEETVHVGKRQVVTGKTRIRKKVTQHEETVNVPGSEEDVEIERVPINKVVEKVPPVRQESDTTIIPIMEEVTVLEKRLVLKEELRITKHRKETHHTEQVTLKREEPEIESVDIESKPTTPKKKS